MYVYEFFINGRFFVMEFVNVVNYTVNDLVGVVGFISFWNFFLYLFFFKVVLVIVCGNVVVVKFSEMTFVIVWKLCEIFKEVGI